MDHRKVQSKAELKQELIATRQAVEIRAEALLHELNYPAKIKRSVQERPLLWGAVVFVGAIAIMKLIMPAKRPVIVSPPALPPAPAPVEVVSKRKSKFDNLLSLGAGLVLPHIKSWAAAAIKSHLNYLKDKYLPPSDTHH